ncbi:ATP-binding cassette domain-containing protein [Pleionea sp. CnH1-48]|uniref:ATP-binding cassette domain-containing protein n=1 Tax=Pleionea sp. CnH1-48 TaxID=2954494 RepID=UPI002096847D|nr:ATP-binding cassette domain-containing protein [Pleionea sp. CnH1-48]MCO7224264.1 ATP-binding cassette domain-containing protein [Pleionea sp. CnH1-48]
MTIELSNVRFRYPEQPHHNLLDIPTWSVPKEEQVFIHGPSGAGKSTLLSLLSGLLSPSEGAIKILGERLDQMSGRQRDQFRAAHIGYVFQQFNLIPYLSAVENISLAARFTQQKNTRALNDEIEELLSALNITEKSWYRPTRHLSIGQQQRVAIARALINKPQLLIADEPTSSLDTVNREAFMKLLMSRVAANQMTLVFVSHDPSLSSYFNRVESLNNISIGGAWL